MSIDQIAFQISLWALPLLLAVTVHEAAHAWAALKLGDHSAFLLGRVSLNPLKHIDPMGTVIVPVLLLSMGSPLMFGWAKPVPVNTRRLKNLKRDEALIAVAGPLSNLLMALAWAVVLKITMWGPWPWPQAHMWLLANSQRGLMINCLLCVFNMLPFPPLDGSKVLFAFLPRSLYPVYSAIEPYGLLMLVGLLFTGILTPGIQWMVYTMTSSIVMLLGIR